jgi:hypothetical protein
VDGLLRLRRLTIRAKEVEILVIDLTIGLSTIDAHLRTGEIARVMKLDLALHIDFGTISPKIKINGVIIIVLMVLAKPAASVSRDATTTLDRVVAAATAILVPTRVVPNKRSGLFNNTLASSARLSPRSARALRRILLTEMSAVSEPEKNASRARKHKIGIIRSRTNIFSAHDLLINQIVTITDA